MTDEHFSDFPPSIKRISRWAIERLIEEATK